MDIGFVSDTHIGLSGDREKKIDIISQAANTFSEKGVECVVHLGDVVDDRGQQPYDEDVSDVMKILSGEYDTYVTPGNHDAVVLNESTFRHYNDLNFVLNENEGHCTVIVDTSMQSKYENCGYISSDGLDLIQNKLSQGTDVTVISHYPTAYSSIGADVFSVFPESAFPLNKVDLYEIDKESEGNIQDIVCGHLHPDKTGVDTGLPIGCDITVIEPVTKFYIDDNEELVSEPNEDINFEDLILSI